MFKNTSILTIILLVLLVSTPAVQAETKDDTWWDSFIDWIKNLFVFKVSEISVITYNDYVETTILEDGFKILNIESGGYYEEDGEIKKRKEVNNLLEAKTAGSKLRNVYCDIQEDSDTGISCESIYIENDKWKVNTKIKAKKEGKYNLNVEKKDRKSGEKYLEDFGETKNLEVGEEINYTFGFDRLSDIGHVGNTSSTVQIKTNATSIGIADTSLHPDEPNSVRPKFDWLATATLNRSSLGFINLTELLPIDITITSGIFSPYRIGCTEANNSGVMELVNKNFSETTETFNTYGSTYGKGKELASFPTCVGAGYVNFTMNIDALTDMYEKNTFPNTFLIRGDDDVANDSDGGFDDRESANPWSAEIKFSPPPVTPIVNLNSTEPAQTNHTNETLSFNFNCEDVLVDNTLTYDFEFKNQTDGVNILLYSEYGKNCANPSFNVIELTPGNTTIHEIYSGNVNITSNSTASTPTVHSNNITINGLAPSTPVAFFPSNNSLVGNMSVLLNCSDSTDADLDNISYEFYRGTTTPVNTLINTSLESEYNQTTAGDFFWRCKAIDDFDNSSFSDTLFFRMNGTIVYNESNSAPLLEVYQTNNYLNNITITINKWNSFDVEAGLDFNGTNFTTTKTLVKNETDLAVFRFERLLDAPLATSLANIWNFTIFKNDGTKDLRNTAFAQTVNPINFSLCDAGITIPFINYTAQDELTGDPIANFTIQASTSQYGLTLALQTNRTLLFNNKTGFPAGITGSYAFCAEPINRTFFVNVDLDYKAPSYSQRNFVQSLSLTNTTTDQTLLLLKTVDGLFVTFQVINEANQPVQGVDVEVKKGGTTIESGTTDDAGGITFFLDPNTLYSITFTKSGFITQTISITPTQPLFTVTMLTSTTATNETNFNQGIKFTIQPSNDTLTNNSIVNFSFDIVSTRFLLTNAGFNLFNGSNLFLDSAICTGDTGCSASSVVDTLDHKSIKMDYFYTITRDDEVSFQNGSRSWRIITSSTRESSLSMFVTDVRILGNGFNDFTKAVLAFMIIIFSVGAFSSSAGLQNPFTKLSLLGLIWAETAILDYVGFIPTPLGSVTDHFIVIVMGVAFIAYAIREFSR